MFDAPRASFLPSAPNGWRRPWLVALAVVGLYALGGIIGLRFATFAGAVTLFWPPTGIAIALLFRFGVHYAPMVALAAFAVNLQAQNWPIAFGIALGNMVGPLMAVNWLQHRRFTGRFDSRQELITFVAAAMLGMAASALNGTVWLYGAGRLTLAELGESFLFWYLGDVAGVLLFAPFLMTFPPIAIISRSEWRARLMESLLLMLVLILIFTEGLPLGFWNLPLVFVPFVLIVRTAALRGIWMASLHLFLVAAALMLSLHEQQGPLQLIPPATRIYLVWGYLLMLAVVGLTATALFGEYERAQRRWQEGDAIYRALVEDNPALICRFHIDGYLAFANETFRRTFGIDTGHTAVANFFTLSGLASVPEFLNRLAAMHYGDDAITADCRRLTMTGDRVFRWSARVVQESSGMGVEFHAVGLDVTEQWRADLERRRIEQQAVQTQKLESVGVLAGGIAHEFNNLLTSVLGNAELAGLSLPEQCDAQALLNEVRQGAQKAAELSQQLLNYSVRGTPHAGLLDLSDTIRSIGNLLKVAVPKRCKLEVDLGEGLPLIAADEARIRQLLMSLVINAGEAASETGGSVTIRTSCVFHDPARDSFVVHGEAPAGWYVSLCVQDQGNGMNREVQKKLFMPFFSTKFPGRGLGLAAVLGIVKDHGGGIAVCSGPGTGTLITVLLPPSDSLTAMMGLPHDFPAHRQPCQFCNSDQSLTETPTYGMRVPLPYRGGNRTGWSSQVHSTGRGVRMPDLE